MHKSSSKKVEIKKDSWKKQETSFSNTFPNNKSNENRNTINYNSKENNPLQPKSFDISSQFFKPNYEVEKLELEQFLREFSDSTLKDKLHGRRKYMATLVRYFYNYSNKFQTVNAIFLKLILEILSHIFLQKMKNFT